MRVFLCVFLLGLTTAFQRTGAEEVRISIHLPSSGGAYNDIQDKLLENFLPGLTVCNSKHRVDCSEGEVSFDDSGVASLDISDEDRVFLVPSAELLLALREKSELRRYIAAPSRLNPSRSDRLNSRILRIDDYLLWARRQMLDERISEGARIDDLKKNLSDPKQPLIEQIDEIEDTITAFQLDDETLDITEIGIFPKHHVFITLKALDDALSRVSRRSPLYFEASLTRSRCLEAMGRVVVSNESQLQTMDHWTKFLREVFWRHDAYDSYLSTPRSTVGGLDYNESCDIFASQATQFRDLPQSLATELRTWNDRRESASSFKSLRDTAFASTKGAL